MEVDHHPQEVLLKQDHQKKGQVTKDLYNPQEAQVVEDHHSPQEVLVVEAHHSLQKAVEGH